MAGLAIGFFWALVIFRPLIGSSGESIWADSFDGNLFYWLFEWGYYSLIQSAEPWNFWHANTFHPLPHSLAVSDSLLSAQLIYSPMRLVGVAPLDAVYLTLGLTFVLCAGLTDFFAQKLGFESLAERLTIVIASHCLMPNTMMLYHYQLFGFQLAPAFIMSLVLFIRKPSGKSGVAVSGIFVLASCYATYMAPMLMAISIPICILVLMDRLQTEEWKAACKSFTTRQVVLSMVPWAVFLFLVQLRPYLLLKKQLGGSGWGEAQTYSANWSSIFNSASKHSLWYGHVSYGYGDWERTLFLGYVPIVALLFCGMILVKDWRKHKTSPIRLPVTLWFVLFAWIWALSTGPFASGTHIKLLFRHMAEIIPGLSSVRAPGRFGMLLGLPIGMILILIIRSISKTRVRVVILTVFSVFALMEATPNFVIEPFKRAHWSTYEDVSTKIRPGSALLELPQEVGDNYSVLQNAMNQMKGSTLHWARIVAGYGARTSAAFSEVLHLDKLVQSEELPTSALLDFMKRHDFRFLLIHLDQAKEPYLSNWRTAIDQCRSCKIISDKDYILIDTLGSS